MRTQTDIANIYRKEALIFFGMIILSMTTTVIYDSKYFPFDYNGGGPYVRTKYMIEDLHLLVLVLIVPPVVLYTYPLRWVKAVRNVEFKALVFCAVLSVILLILCQWFDSPFRYSHMKLAVHNALSEMEFVFVILAGLFHIVRYVIHYPYLIIKHWKGNPK